MVLGVLLSGCSADPAPVPVDVATLLEGGTSTPLGETVDLPALHEHRTEYLGDASSVVALTAAVGLGTQGGRTIALDTDERPYALTVELTSVDEGGAQDRIDRLMTDRAALLLATIGNADEVRWDLPDDGTDGALTRTAADALAGAPVATLGSTAGGLDELAQRLARPRDQAGALSESAARESRPAPPS